MNRLHVDTEAKAEEDCRMNYPHSQCTRPRHVCSLSICDTGKEGSRRRRGIVGIDGARKKKRENAAVESLCKQGGNSAGIN
jgi:hypothetical protein